MLMIRLARVGKKKHPTYRVVLQEKQKAASSTVLETLGHYTPHTHPATLEVAAERVSHWMSKGAQLSDTLHNVFVERKIIESAKRKITRTKRKSAEEAAAEKSTDAAASQPEKSSS